MPSVRTARFQQHPNNHRNKEPRELIEHKRDECKDNGGDGSTFHEGGSESARAAIEVAGRHEDTYKGKPNDDSEASHDEQDERDGLDNNCQPTDEVAQCSLWLRLIELAAAEGAEEIVAIEIRDLVAANPAPIGTTSLAGHVVAASSLLGPHSTDRAGLGVPQRPLLHEPLLLRGSLPVFGARLTNMRVGMVVAKLRFANWTMHLGDDIVVLVRGRSDELRACWTLSDCGILLHLPESLVLPERLRVR
mmetsp:Transcript_84261/g.176341  ORF Transcript_84261/g.176341 Transcript_84261/m.176341 type:complete len:248 (+) Transcript_84261:708-1451(+)